MKNKILTLSSVFTLAMFLGGCAEKKIAEQKNTDTSHNIFTGSTTQTETQDSTYKNRRTGAITKKNSKTETKYDSNGKKISETKETENK